MSERIAFPTSRTEYRLVGIYEEPVIRIRPREEPKGWFAGLFAPSKPTPEPEAPPEVRVRNSEWMDWTRLHFTAKRHPEADIEKRVVDDGFMMIDPCEVRHVAPAKDGCEISLTNGGRCTLPINVEEFMTRIGVAVPT